MTTSIQVDYQFQSETFSEAWKTGISSNKTAKLAMNEMVRILLEEHKDWSIREALMTICSEHEDLEGLSVSSMYRHLSTENRKMLQDSNVSSDKEETPKKDTEQSQSDALAQEEDFEKWEKEKDNVPVKDSTQFYKEQEPEEPTELELANIKIAQLEDALHKTEQFKPATALEGSRLSLDETAVFEFLAKSEDGVKRYWYPNYGIELFRNRILTDLKGRGVKTFKRLYFEV